MTMNIRDVKSVLVKLMAATMLIAMLIGMAVPTVLAAEEGTTEEATTEEATTAPEQTAPTADLSEDSVKKLASLLASNDAARQLFLAACGYNQTGTYYKYKANYVNSEKKQFNFDSTLSIEDGFDVMATWEEASAEALAILKQANEWAKSDLQTDIPASLTEKDVEAIVNQMKTEVDLDAKGNFIDTILQWIGVGLKWATKYLTFGTNNYILSLLYFGIVIELLMLPFGIQQQKNSIKQAKLRPKEMAIRKHYAGRNDQQTMQKVNQEIQELYQKENYNPMSGCLPLLLQLPIVFALYYVVIDPIFYVLGQAKTFSTAISQYFTTSVAAGGFGGSLNSQRGTIEVLSKLGEQGIDAFESLKTFSYFSNAEECFAALEQVVADGIPSFSIGAWNFGLTPGILFQGGGNFATYWWLILVPVLTFVVYFGSMKLNRKLTYQPTTGENDKAMGCSNNIMDIMMPAMSVYIAFIVPAAVGVYWMFKSVLGTLKQFILKKAMPFPVFTDEDYKAAEKEMYGKTSKQKSKPAGNGSGSGASGAKVRSLHHIDDDEYDERGNYIGRPEAVEQTNETAEPKNEQAPAMAEPLKDESDKKTESEDDSQNS